MWAGRPRSLKAGTKYRGEFEERVEALVREASLEPKPILFIDEIHLLLGAGRVQHFFCKSQKHQQPGHLADGA